MPRYHQLDDLYEFASEWVQGISVFDAIGRSHPPAVSEPTGLQLGQFLPALSRLRQTIGKVLLSPHVERFLNSRYMRNL
jgi:hypothetical protein